MLLKNKTILVTGSSQGIGKAIAEYCLTQGANVMLHGLDSQLPTELSRIYNSRVGYLAIDLTEKDATTKLIQATIEHFGQLDGLVNNAGIFPRTTLQQVTEEDFDLIMNINCKVPLMLCQQAAEFFQSQHRAGSIVNIGSINAYCGQTDLVIYSMSKGALMTMTRNLADALAPDNIRVNQLNVGWTATETEIELKKQEGLGDDWQTTIPKVYAPQGQILKPEHIAPHVGFWLSDISAPCSAAIYEVEQYPVIGRNRINDIRSCNENN